LRKSQGRIKSMALVHEQLYQTSDFSRIDVRTYVTRLLDSIGKTFDADRKNVRHTIDIMVSLELDTLIPCGLILTELITNSFKHGFAEGQGGEIVIHMRYLDDHTVKLVYGDSGPGVPDALDIRTTGGLGLKLVDTLITQLEG
ncbi:MAG: hypothetical protein GWN77_00525, partial [Gammaproteobacteria bacterium]|nr:hypothetical protein [Gammaproteobacteria bacterium]